MPSGNYKLPDKFISAMFCLTKQEKSVLLFIGAVAMAGISINYISKHNPRFKGYFADAAIRRASHPSKIDLNKASLEELTELSGIGPELAQRIIDFRNASGGFRTIEDLKKVRGIGSHKLELIRDEISIE